ncbi:MAG TPA: hypothetical protein EYP68_03115 [Candidatus Korarchaeota archaeon]|nr:hypothetical protein [Candidatus Korarchaeota archaeon]
MKKEVDVRNINKTVHGAVRKTLEDIFGKVVASFILKEAYLSGYDPLDPVTTIDKLLKMLKSLFGRGSIVVEKTMADEVKMRLGLKVNEFKEFSEIIRILKETKHNP